MTKTRPKNTPSQTGLSAKLAAFLHIQGIGASKTSSAGATATPKLKLVSFCISALTLAAFATAATPALAATPSPGWAIDSQAAPTNFSVDPGPRGDVYEVEVRNAGGVASNGEPVVVEDKVPAGLTVTGAPGSCTVTGQLVRCEYVQSVQPETCTEADTTCGESSRLEVPISVMVDEPAVSGPLTNTVTVSGGGAHTVTATSTNPISSGSPSFGPSNFNFFIDGVDGTDDSEAGGHPYQLTTTIDLNSVRVESASSGGPFPSSVQDLKDVVVDLPLGFVGSTLAAPQCTLTELSSLAHCPRETQIGYIKTEPSIETSAESPIWNLTPDHGAPAEFGYIDTTKNAHEFYAHVVPTPWGYVLRVTASEIPQIILSHILVTFYGNPAVRDENEHAQVPFFTNPSDCAPNPVTGNPEPLTATVWVDSWQNPAKLNANGTPVNLNEEVNGKKVWVEKTSESPPVTGCDALSFTPGIGSQPTTHAADTPSGLEFEQRLPQTEVANVPATPALKNTTISFPAGMTVDPSSADGLDTCSEAQIGYEGPTLFDFSEAPPQCPESSKIGSLELETPLIPGILHGEVFLAAQNENPFGSTFATYIVVNDPVTGVVLKLAGEVKANSQTGQLAAEFNETPQLPFSVLKAHFFGGPRAEFATPPNCGIYTTNSVLEPWSAPDSGLPATPFDSYEIDENCAIGFAPAFTGAGTNLQAGAYTSFVGSFSREDSDQELQGLTMNLPPGLLADVASVPECGAAEIAAEAADGPGGCPAGTQVGTVIAEAGPGPNPLSVPGKVFFTGPYNGGPFGLAVVVAANPGPFHFGNVLVRQSLRINPLTAAVTDVSDPFPTFIHPVGANGQTNGISIKLRRVDFDINGAGGHLNHFTFNPTSCAKHQVGGVITSVDAQSKALEAPFQVTNCAALQFAPKFSVSTSGKTSRALGASLTAKVTYPYGPQGTYANIARVKVELPKALPSRLTTLQKACLAKTFEANPASCPAPSVIGHATATTPILSVPIQGPVYFVSHGGEAFPSLEMVLQGDGVTIDLVGTTFISKAGITSTTFKTVPDAPVQSFQLTLPEGRYSALAANGHLCTKKLVMPNEFIAQNGLAIHESTKISVSGCKKSKPKKAKKHKHKQTNHGKRNH
jgi:uncharacterized repeat protein (TIGR01451 family)